MYVCLFCKSTMPKFVTKGPVIGRGQFGRPVLSISGDPFKRLGLMNWAWWAAFIALTAALVVADVVVKTPPALALFGFACAFSVYAYKGVRQVSAMFFG